MPGAAEGGEGARGRLWAETRNWRQLIGLCDTSIVPRRLSSKAILADADADAGTVIAFPTPMQPKNPLAVALGKLGGSKGGIARAKNLTTEQKEAIARQGGLARQAKARVKKLAEASASSREGSSGQG